ncbi:STAS domain-containing protein [Paenibacillus allorhizosphaerae]|uniref:STAS domain-containing protein n=1 Tax=Paenibacillus allorhizosphaerae TaxID=2849866 RepID=A0ABN7TLI0_9BACL|nr:STAS domain-containing protein [Paenibacillus allorhizosphaerae]CAG7645623.1 hypothetical protein PAECIP111802_03564 [Paenibacillus allorhizosphaerae]
MTRRESFQIDMMRKEGRNMVWITGELDLSKVGELRRTLDPLIADTGRQLILNLKRLEYIDSTGIGVIVSVLKARDLLNAHFAVEEIPLKIKRLFDLTGITPFLQPSDTSFASNSTAH